MAGINFDAMPTDAGGFTPVAGIYKVKVKKATMKQPKDPAKPKYLSCEYELTAKDGKTGKMWDNFFASEAQAIQFKLGRLNTAAKLGLRGNVELADIGKILVGREYVVDAKVTDDGRFLEADIFNDDIFWPIESFQEIWDARNPDEASTPFDETPDTPITPSAPAQY